MELQRDKRRAFHEDEPVSLRADLASKPSWQTILELKDPRDLPEDLVFSLMEGGRPLTVVEDICPIFRAYTPVGGHVCGTNPAEDYYHPTIIRKQRAAALRLLNDNVMRGGCLGVVFDETTNCCDRHPVNIIMNTPERVCYTTTAFIGRKEAINSLTVAKAVMEAWEQLGLPRDHVGSVLVVGYYAKAFKDHLAPFFGNTRLRTCRAHSANRFGVAMQEHKELADMRNYMRWMCSLLWGAQQAQRRQKYIDFTGESPPSYMDTRWSSSMEIAVHHSKYLHGEYQWLKQQAGDHKKKRVNETDENGEVVQLPTVLQNALDVLGKKCIILHPSLTFYADMGDPIYKFIEGIQIDVVPKGGRDGERRPIAHQLYARVPELEAKLETFVQDVT